MSEKRITPDEVLLAYELTGLTPALFRITPSEGLCCGLGAVVAMHGRTKSGYGYEWAESVYGKEYVEGFTRGFDWHDMPEDEDDAGVDREREGYEDGRAAALAVFGAAR